MRVVARSDIRSRPFERPPRNIIRSKRIRTRIPIIYRYILFIMFVHDIRTMTSRGSWCACSDRRDIVFHVVATALCVIFSRERKIYITNIYYLYTLLHCIRVYTGRRRRDENPKNEKRIYLLLFFFSVFPQRKTHHNI